jgi:hypothetical protein
VPTISTNSPLEMVGTLPPSLFELRRTSRFAHPTRLRSAYLPTRVQVSPPQSAPTQPSTRSVSGPATEMLLA